MDLLSEGRLEIGLGAGWMISDYEQAGHALRPGAGAHRPLRRGSARSSAARCPARRSPSTARTTRVDRLRRPPAARAAAVPADPHRRRRQARARHRRAGGRHRRDQRHDARGPHRPGHVDDDDRRSRRREGRLSCVPRAGERFGDDRDEHPHLHAAGHRRPRTRRSPTSPPGSASRPTCSSARRSPCSAARRRSSRTSSPGASAGASRTSSSGPRRSSRSLRSSPSWPGAVTATVGDADGRAVRRRVDRRRPRRGHRAQPASSSPPSPRARRSAPPSRPHAGAAAPCATTSCPAGADVVVVATPAAGARRRRAPPARRRRRGAAGEAAVPHAGRGRRDRRRSGRPRRAAALRREPGLRPGGGGDGRPGRAASGRSPTSRCARSRRCRPGARSPPTSGVAARCSTSASTRWRWSLLLASAGRRRPADVRSRAELRGGAGHGTDEHAEVDAAFASGLTAHVVASWQGSATEPMWDVQAASATGVLRLELLPAVLLEHDGAPVALPAPTAALGRASSSSATSASCARWSTTSQRRSAPDDERSVRPRGAAGGLRGLRVGRDSAASRSPCRSPVGATSRRSSCGARGRCPRRPPAGQIALTFRASSPLRPGPTSNSTCWPSSSDR